MIFSSVLPMLISINALLPLNNTDTVLSESQFKEMFPDAKMRTVIKRYIHPDELTISKIKSLDGEFYASGEGISNLEGIEYLENIDKFVFWNNNIKEVPKEIDNLNKLESINLANNYITDREIVNKLKSKNVDVNSDLNFIEAEKYQYNLYSKKDSIDLKVGEKFDLKNILYKKIDDYGKPWEVTEDLSKNLNFVVDSDNDNLKVDKDTITALKAGSSKLKISLNKGNNSTQLIINININK